MVPSTPPQRHGQGVMVYHKTSSMKSTFNGDWRYGLRHGQGELVMFDGSVYRGLWENDKPHGKGNYSVPTANYYYSGERVLSHVATCHRL